VRSASVISSAHRAAFSPGNPAARKQSAIIKRMARAGILSKFSSAMVQSNRLQEVF
jgi:hypothetical protein